MYAEVSFRESSDSTEFDVVSSLLSGKGKWSSDIFNEPAMQSRTWACKCLAMAIRASHGP